MANDPIREALAELVRLKAIKDRIDAADPFEREESRAHMDRERDYRRNKDRAWNAARAALAAPASLAWGNIQTLADKVTIFNATGDEPLFRAAARELLAGVRALNAAPAAQAAPQLGEDARPVAHLEILEGGEIFLGSLRDNVELLKLSPGLYALGIVGSCGVDCHTPQPAAPAPMPTPRYDTWRHLRTNGVWPGGIPDWARDRDGRMSDSIAARAVIEELAAIVVAQPPAQAAPTVPDYKPEHMRNYAKAVRMQAKGTHHGTLYSAAHCLMDFADYLDALTAQGASHAD